MSPLPPLRSRPTTKPAAPTHSSASRLSTSPSASSQPVRTPRALFGYRHPLTICPLASARMVQSQRAASGSGGPPSLGRSATQSSTGSTGSRSPASSTFKKAPPPPPSSLGASGAPPPYSPPAAGSNVGAAAAALAKKAPPPPPPLKPKPKPAAQYVVALYDFEAQADGDLDFRAGDRIEVVERTESTEDWWTGRLNGRQGVFPGACP